MLVFGFVRFIYLGVARFIYLSVAEGARVGSNPTVSFDFWGYVRGSVYAFHRFITRARVAQSAAPTGDRHGFRTLARARPRARRLYPAINIRYMTRVKRACDCCPRARARYNNPWDAINDIAAPITFEPYAPPRAANVATPRSNSLLLISLRLNSQRCKLAAASVGAWPDDRLQLA